jgi:glycosyltransferase involved in cell wall biosynthesis
MTLPAGKILEAAAPELSLVIFAREERPNLTRLLPEVSRVLESLGCEYEVIVVDANSRDGSGLAARQLGAAVVSQRGRGFGDAYREGLRASRGRWVVTMDADLSHPAASLADLFRQRSEADLVIASRYVNGGSTRAEIHRDLLSRILCSIFGRLLRLPVLDVSSGLRMYRREAVIDLPLSGENFDIAIEAVALLHAKGARIKEIPFHYARRAEGRSNVNLVQFSWTYLKLLCRLFLRRSPESRALPADTR